MKAHMIATLSIDLLFNCNNVQTCRNGVLVNLTNPNSKKIALPEKVKLRGLVEILLPSYFNMILAYNSKYNIAAKELIRSQDLNNLLCFLKLCLVRRY